MKVVIQETTSVSHEVDSHSQFLYDIFINSRIKLTGEQFMEYITNYKPPLEFAGKSGYIYDWVTFVARQYLILPPSEIIKVFECIFKTYNIDANYVDTFGSPLVLYAIQSNHIDVIKFLISSGARLTRDGKGIFNEKYKIRRIDIPYCLSNRGDTGIHNYVKECIYQQLIN